MPRSLFRVPSPSRSLRARTTGRAKRATKKAANPFYGKKGVGLAKNPKKSAYNYAYHRTSYGVSDIKHTHSSKGDGDVAGGLAIIIVVGMMIIGFFVEHPLFLLPLALIVFLFIWYKYKKHLAAKTDEIQTQSVPQNNTQTITKNKGSNDTTAHQCQHIKSEFEQYLKSEPKIDLENGKRVNQRTGYPLSKQSVIESNQYGLRQLLHQPKRNDYIDADDYFIDVYLPYLYAGELAYKQGDWDKAEKWWLTALNLRPEVISKKLAIMYRKQHRYQDVVDMYSQAINECKNSPRKIRDSFYQNMVHEFIKAGNKALQYKNVDKSQGIQNYDSPADMQFAASLAK